MIGSTVRSSSSPRIGTTFSNLSSLFPSNAHKSLSGSSHIIYAHSEGKNHGSSKSQTTLDHKAASELIPEFCIIEASDSFRDFDSIHLEELELNIQSRRNKIFLLMEEVRRLKIQQRVKQGKMVIGSGNEFSVAREKFKSALPFMPPVTEKTLQGYTAISAIAATSIILFGGLVAPILEVKLGLGGLSYREFIQSIHLPEQLAEVDPIVASFCGGAVGVLTALLIVEANNIRAHAHERCFYCQGSGYLSCGQCNGKGWLGVLESKTKEDPRCQNCTGTGIVMCTSCLCTGKQLATEYDPRLDPWN